MSVFVRRVIHLCHDPPHALSDLAHLVAIWVKGSRCSSHIMRWWLDLDAGVTPSMQPGLQSWGKKTQRINPILCPQNVMMREPWSSAAASSQDSQGCIGATVAVSGVTILSANFSGWPHLCMVQTLQQLSKLSWPADAFLQGKSQASLCLRHQPTFQRHMGRIDYDGTAQRAAGTGLQIVRNANSIAATAGSRTGRLEFCGCGCKASD